VESVAYDEALSSAKTNKQWADINELPLRSWLTNRTELANGWRTANRPGARTSQNAVYPVNVGLRHATLSQEDIERYQRHTQRWNFNVRI